MMLQKLIATAALFSMANAMKEDEKSLAPKPIKLYSKLDHLDRRERGWRTSVTLLEHEHCPICYKKYENTMCEVYSMKITESSVMLVHRADLKSYVSGEFTPDPTPEIRLEYYVKRSDGSEYIGTITESRPRAGAIYQAPREVVLEHQSIEERKGLKKVSVDLRTGHQIVFTVKMEESSNGRSQVITLTGTNGRYFEHKLSFQNAAGKRDANILMQVLSAVSLDNFTLEFSLIQAIADMIKFSEKKRSYDKRKMIRPGKDSKDPNGKPSADDDSKRRRLLLRWRVPLRSSEQENAEKHVS